MLKLRAISKNKNQKSLLTQDLVHGQEMRIDLLHGTTIYKDQDGNNLKLKQKVGDIYIMEEMK